MDEQAAEYLACLAKLRENPLDPEALLRLAALYAEEGHWKHAVWYMRKVEFLDRHHPGLPRLKNRLRRWEGLNGSRVPSSPESGES
ncbi:MAG: hypothetical protein V3U70_00785 [Thermoplasmata archaeon]|jgi:hypothetical protein